MSRNYIYKYYVEGEGEKRIIDVLKKDYKCIKPGKVEVFNVNQKRFSDMRLRTLKSNVKSVICIPQVENLEDELMAACDIKEVKEITKSKSNTNYKADLLKCNNLYNRMRDSGFDYGKFWKKMPKNSYAKHGNGSELINV